MIPEAHKEIYAQEFRDTVIRLMKNTEDFPIRFHNGAVVISDDVVHSLGVQDEFPIIVISEWFNDMEYISKRAQYHDDYYSTVILAVLVPDGQIYRIVLAELPYDKLSELHPALTVNDYLGLTSNKLSYQLDFHGVDLKEMKRELLDIMF